ncbi:DUF551 domain-containing protein [Salmonella enterica]|nr:DUF551 domain-containing protein [Salmonella enterica subsp. arizonae]EHN2303509.1 DUF551 domain-containing protein [Salmonella enterica]
MVSVDGVTHWMPLPAAPQHRSTAAPQQITILALSGISIVVNKNWPPR